MQEYTKAGEHNTTWILSDTSVGSTAAKAFVATLGLTATMPIIEMSPPEEFDITSDTLAIGTGFLGEKYQHGVAGTCSDEDLSDSVHLAQLMAERVVEVEDPNDADDYAQTVAAVIVSDESFRMERFNLFIEEIKARQRDFDWPEVQVWVQQPNGDFELC